MKYWRGYLVAALFAAVTWGLTAFAKANSVLLDMVYPYVTRMIQTALAQWTSEAAFCLWQLFAIVLVVALLASVVVMIVLKWNVAQWFGWVLAAASFLWMVHTGIFGLNTYTGPLAEDIRLETTVGATVTQLSEATTHFRDQANELALQVPRNSDGTLNYPTFEELAASAGQGFQNLTYQQSFPVFAGSTVPVKRLGWADMYSAMGIAGITMPLTGEAAVNPNLPVMSLPFTMAHEMAHRMCIASERDANFAAFLACNAHDDPIFRYSAYFMALRYSYNALASLGTSTAQAAAKEIYAGMNDEVKADLQAYRDYLTAYQKPAAVNVANSVNDTYIKVSGDDKGVQSYGEVTDLLVSWYIQEIYLPAHKEEEVVFDPTDRNQVDLGESTGGK